MDVGRFLMAKRDVQSDPLFTFQLCRLPISSVAFAVGFSENFLRRPQQSYRKRNYLPVTIFDRPHSPVGTDHQISGLWRTVKVSSKTLLVREQKVGKIN
jgi:hypothetical protein